MFDFKSYYLSRKQRIEDRMMYLENTPCEEEDFLFWSEFYKDQTKEIDESLEEIERKGE